MPRNPPTCTRVLAVALGSAAVLGMLTPEAAAADRAERAAWPLPVPPAESLVTEGVTVEGPLVNNITLPTTK